MKEEGNLAETQTLLQNRRLIFLILGPLCFLAVLLGVSEVDPSVRAVLAVTAWMAIWWISEAISISATALLPIVLFPVLGVTNVQTVTTTYFSPIVVLYMGGFILAIAIEKWGLHKRIALSIINLVGTDHRRIILGFMLATFFLSMWISNTATTLMILPIALSVIGTTNSSGSHQGFNKSLMLAVAYSASIGGIATLIGTPTNLIFSGLAYQYYGIQISFGRWIAFGLPLGLALLLIAWAYLTRQGADFQVVRVSHTQIQSELKQLGRVSAQERVVIIVFIATALAWVGRTFLINPFFPQVDDTVIAVGGALTLFVARITGLPILKWEDTKELPWGILLVFGGGLALAKGIEISGLAEWLAGHFQALDVVPFFIVLLAVILFVNFFTEITSNVATASVMLPILAPLSQSFGVHPFGLMVGACLAASCAFMLPVATPPNAIVFGSGHIRMRDMVRAGIWMNLMTTIILTICIYWILPVVWGFDLFSFPF